VIVHGAESPSILVIEMDHWSTSHRDLRIGDATTPTTFTPLIPLASTLVTQHPRVNDKVSAKNLAVNSHLRNFYLRVVEHLHEPFVNSRPEHSKPELPMRWSTTLPEGR
jgi:hypothetical protein